jgi:hypothetical protein
MNRSETFRDPAAAWTFYFSLHQMGMADITTPTYVLDGGDRWTVSWVMPATLLFGDSQ